MKKLTMALIGNPNCGKSTLFNALTGSRQRVGNWAGVTVARNSGYFEIAEQHIEVVDLPGIYNLAVTSDGALDEKIAAEYLLSDDADLIVNVIDATNIERALYLTTQLLELNKPLILAVNMIDAAKKRGLIIDLAGIAAKLKCPIVPLISSRKVGLDELKQAIVDQSKNTKQISKLISYPAYLESAIEKLAAKIDARDNYFLALRLLEGDALAYEKVAVDIAAAADQDILELSKKAHEDLDIIIAGARYSEIHRLVKTTVKKMPASSDLTTARIDRLVLNRFLGIPIFLAVMYGIFSFAVGFGSYLQNIFQVISNKIFVQDFAALLLNWHLPDWLINILAFGVGKGINTSITFIPVLTAMFIALAVLENTGYMARASFVVDRLMTAIGLPGKAFVPMLIGFGCNVPAIMASRTLEHPRDRILTSVMSAFMSCGARLAVYAVFTAAFFPRNAHNIVFLLYLIGIVVAVLTGLVLRKTILGGQQSALISELPMYHWPTFNLVWQQTWCQLRSFLLKAGQVIIPICVVISILNTITIGEHQQSLLGVAGQVITPLLKPIGVQPDNWPATVGLVTGVVSKEVVVATMNTLYVKDFFGEMYVAFGGQIGAFAYLLFVLLYFPCVPALVAMLRELGWRWAVFAMLWNTGVAFCVATLFYQIATFSQNRSYATSWIAIIIAVVLATILIMKKIGGKNHGRIKF
jgi:ferrous iron transport protein B